MRSNRSTKPHFLHEGDSGFYSFPCFRPKDRKQNRYNIGEAQPYVEITSDTCALHSGVHVFYIGKDIYIFISVVAGPSLDYYLSRFSIRRRFPLNLSLLAHDIEEECLLKKTNYLRSTDRRPGSCLRRWCPGRRAPGSRSRCRPWRPGGPRRSARPASGCRPASAPSRSSSGRSGPASRPFAAGRSSLRNCWRCGSARCIRCR